MTNSHAGDIALGCSSSPATLLKLYECQTGLIFLCVWREWKAETWIYKIMMLWVDRSSDSSPLMPNTKGLTSRRLRCINTLEDHNASEWTCTHRQKLVGRSENPKSHPASASFVILGRPQEALFQALALHITVKCYCKIFDSAQYPAAHFVLGVKYL